MESFLQQWFKSAGRGVSRVKETVHLAAGWADLANLDENETEREFSIAPLQLSRTLYRNMINMAFCKLQTSIHPATINLTKLFAISYVKKT